MGDPWIRKVATTLLQPADSSGSVKPVAFTHKQHIVQVLEANEELRALLVSDKDVVIGVMLTTDCFNKLSKAKQFKELRHSLVRLNRGQYHLTGAFTIAGNRSHDLLRDWITLPMAFQCNSCEFFSDSNLHIVGDNVIKLNHHKEMTVMFQRMKYIDMVTLLAARQFPLQNGQLPDCEGRFIASPPYSVTFPLQPKHSSFSVREKHIFDQIDTLDRNIILQQQQEAIKEAERLRTQDTAAAAAAAVSSGNLLSSGGRKGGRIGFSETGSLRKNGNGNISRPLAWDTGTQRDEEHTEMPSPQSSQELYTQAPMDQYTQNTQFTLLSESQLQSSESSAPSSSSRSFLDQNAFMTQAHDHATQDGRDSAPSSPSRPQSSRPQHSAVTSVLGPVSLDFMTREGLEAMSVSLANSRLTVVNSHMNSSAKTASPAKNSQEAVPLLVPSSQPLALVSKRATPAGKSPPRQSATKSDTRRVTSPEATTGTEEYVECLSPPTQAITDPQNIVGLGAGESLETNHVQSSAKPPSSRKRSMGQKAIDEVDQPLQYEDEDSFPMLTQEPPSKRPSRASAPQAPQKPPPTFAPASVPYDPVKAYPVTFAEKLIFLRSCYTSGKRTIGRSSTGMLIVSLLNLCIFSSLR